jgi:integrase
MRTLNRLTAMKVAKAKTPKAGKGLLLSDGGGLYLRVAPGGSKQFIFRYVVNGRLRDMGLGPTHTLSLEQARERAREARVLRLDGIDPIEAKRARMAALRAEAAKSMTFGQCVDGYFRDHANTWKEKHRTDWINSLRLHAIPTLGSLPVAAIDTALVLRVLKPIWTTIPETARRIGNRIETVLDWATAHHYREGDNPARWDGRLEHALPARRKIAPLEHHAALPYTEIAAFLAKLREDTGVAARCLEFIILTATRLSEAIFATWDEIDLDGAIWTIPESRMKAGKEHRVPLSRAALSVLASMKAIRQSAYVFPGRLEGKPIGDNSVWRIASVANVTVHGFRSCFRDWAAERTSYPGEVAEMALAHAIPNAVEAAYRRGDLFEKRRRLMDAWAEFCGKPQAASKVVAIRA